MLTKVTPSKVRLRYLYESARLGTMRAASEKLNVAPSSISRQLAELERELGLPVFEKARRQIKLTDAGDILCTFFRESLSHEEALFAKLEEIKHIRKGNVRMAVGEAFITDDFCNALHQFMSKYPGISVDVVVGSSTRSTEELVREDEAHFGLIFDTPSDPRVEARTTRPEPLKLVARSGHPVFRENPLNLAALRKFNLALPGELLRIREVIHAAERYERTSLEPSLVTNGMPLLKRIAISGQAVTILPEWLIQTELSNGTLCALATTNPILNGTKVSLIVRLGRQLPKWICELMARLEGHLRH